MRFACSVFLVSLLVAGIARADEQRPAESKVLDQLVGRWDIAAEGKVLAPKPKTIRATGIADVSWVLEHQFQQANGTFKADDPQARTSNVQMTRWDATARQYRRWTFDSNGTTLEWTGTWDQQAKAFTWHAQRNGVRYDQTYRIQTADTHAYETLVRDADGNLLAELHAKVTRHREPEGTR